jgi:hypothetical protein
VESVTHGAIMRDFQDRSELIEVDMPQGRDLVALTREVQAPDAACIPVRGSLFGPLRGTITPVRKVGDRHCFRPDEVFVLPEGAVMSLPAGHRISVLKGKTSQGNGEWVDIDLAEEARAVGPLVWGWAYPKTFDVKALALKLTEKDREARSVKSARLAMMIGLVVTCSLSMFAGTLGVETALVASGAVTGLFVSLFGGVFVKMWKDVQLVSNLTPPTKVLYPNGESKYHTSLPSEYQDLVAYLSKAATPSSKGKRVDVLDEELAQALSRYEDAYRQIYLQTDLHRNSRNLLKHTWKLVSEIAGNIVSVPHLVDNDDLRRDFLDLVQRAEAELQKALQARQVDESLSVKADIEALKAQIEKYGAAV